MAENNRGKRGDEFEDEEEPRRSYRQADDGLDGRSRASASRPSGSSSRPSGSGARGSASQGASIEDKQRGRGPRPTRPGAVAEVESHEPSDTITSNTASAVSHAELDARAKNRARSGRAAPATAPGVTMERASAPASARDAGDRPGAVSATGGNQAGKSSGRTAATSAAARRTASTQSQNSASSASVGAVSASGGNQQGKASGRSATQSREASLAALSVSDQRSLRSMEADVIAKGRARPRSSASTPGAVVDVAATSTPDPLASMRRAEADVLSKQQAHRSPPTPRSSAAPRSSARAAATAVSDDDGFGDAVLYQPQQEPRSAAPVAAAMATTSVATSREEAPRTETAVATSAMAYSDNDTYAGIVPIDAGTSGIEAFVADQVFEATGVAVVMSEEEEEILEQKKYRRYCIIGVISFVLLTIAIVVPVVVVLGGPNKALERVPTTSPSNFPTTTPSLSPTSARFDEALKMLSAISGTDVLFGPEALSAPQYHAALWVSDEDALQLPLGSAQFLQRYYLATFYFALGGDNWEQCGRLDPTCGGDPAFNAWLIGTESECSWLGIGCLEGSVTEIFFRRVFGNNLVGVLPLEVSFLTDVSNIILANNAISGSIPSFLGKLTKLTNLYLLGNSFTGSLSEELFQNLNLLTGVQLGRLKLNGTIPASLAALTTLGDLRLEENQFTGTIPASLGKNPALSKSLALMLDLRS
jgi:hypothetical protein